MDLQRITQIPDENLRPTPILFVHGSWHGAWCWEKFLPYFANKLVLAGANDRTFSVAEEQATARAYHTEAEVFPDMAHDMMLEPGWQKVAERIVDWLQSRGL
jgi:pimeloyl-ACP methyl ester carboxylesterase